MMKNLTLALATLLVTGSHAFVAPGNNALLSRSNGLASFSRAPTVKSPVLVSATTDGSSTSNICPLLDPPTNPEATFEAAMG
jgi:hypothetical protein